MIVDALMGILQWVVDLLPEWSPLGWLPDTIGDLQALPVVGTAIGALAWLDHYAPVSEMFYLLGIAATVLAASAVYRGVMWVWRNLPGKAT